MNNNEVGTGQQQTPRDQHKRGFFSSKWGKVSIFLFVVVCLLMMWSGGKSDIARFGESLGGRYSHYQNKVYVAIGQRSDYLVPDADVATFSVLNQVALGKDQNHVYCGTSVIVGLDPQKAKLIGDSYVTDGATAWYCTSERDNPNYDWWVSLTSDDREDNAEKTRSQDYQLIMMTNVNVSQLTAPKWQGYVIDNQSIFYQGVKIDGADVKTVSPVLIGLGAFKGQEDAHYFKDNQQVYYAGQALANANPNSFYSFSPDGDRWQNHYGYDTQNDRYYFKASEFPDVVIIDQRKKLVAKLNDAQKRQVLMGRSEDDGEKESRHLKLLLANRQKANHELFINQQSIFYWDYKDQQLKFACDSPFRRKSVLQKQSTSLADGVWSDGFNTFVTRRHDKWSDGQSALLARGNTLRTNSHSKSTNSKLISRNTEIILLPGIGISDWQRVEILSDGIWTAGEVWLGKGQYYLAPKLGSGYRYEMSLYRIKDYSAFKKAWQQDNMILGLLDRYLKPIDGKSICTIHTFS